MMNQHAQTWLATHCRMISGVHNAILVLGQSTDSAMTPAAYWPNRLENAEFLVKTGRMSLSKKKVVLQSNLDKNHSNNKKAKLFVCAFPLTCQDSVIGALVIQVEKLNKDKLRGIQQILDWGSVWLNLSPSNSETAAIAARLATVLEITAKSLEHATLQESASSVITNLAQVFNCSRVSFGQLQDARQIHVAALSHSAQVDRRSEVVQRIESAMEEALDESRCLTHPSLPINNGSPIWPLHKQLCQNDNKRTACTLLLNNNGTPAGAITLERKNGQPFDQVSVEVLEAVAALIGPVFEIKRLQELPALTKAKLFILDYAAKLIGRDHFKSKVGTAFVILLVLFLSLTTDVYRVSASATLEGTEHRALVSAIDGFVDEAHRRAGEKVHKGDLIATLDTSSLKMKQRQLQSKRENLSKKHDRAIGDFDRAEATILQAQLGTANAELSLIEDQIKRTQITAPIDGIIVSGDLSHTLGGPVERGQVLFEIAPLEGYRMALQVSETDIAHVQPGQKGQLALAAAPDQRMSFIVEDIIGIAVTDEGKNGFRVEARLESDTGQLRPGMQGVGKIETTERSLLWIWGHNLFDRLSLWMWSKLP